MNQDLYNRAKAIANEIADECEERISQADEFGDYSIKDKVAFSSDRIRRSDLRSLATWDHSSDAMFGQCLAEKEMDELIADSTDKLMDQIREEATGHARTTVNAILGQQASFHNATYGWLFVQDPKSQSLYTVATHNVKAMRPLSLDTKAIVTQRIAERLTDYINGDLVSDQNYLNETNDSNSAMGVPILWQGKLLGVFYLECTLPDAFITTQLFDLHAAAKNLTPQLLLLQDYIASGDRLRCGPFPLTLCFESLLQRFLTDWVDAISAMHPDIGANLSVWNVDWDKDVLWVQATTGYDHEFQQQKMLSLQSSHTGQAARCEIGQLHDSDYSDIFTQKKRRRMGIDKVISMPVFPDPKESGRRRPISVVNLYLNNRNSDVDYWKPALREMTTTVSRLFRWYYYQKARLVPARIRRRVDLKSCPFVPLVESIKSEFGCNECSLFASVDQERVVGIASTGLEVGPDEKPISGRLPPQVVYEMNNPDDQGFTVFFATRDVIARKNDVPDPDEKGLPSGFPRSPSNKFREEGEAGVTEHRRLLVAGFGTGKTSVEHPRFVLRLIRKSNSIPFSEIDQKILKSTLYDLVIPHLSQNADQVAKIIRERTESASKKQSIFEAFNRIVQSNTSLSYRKQVQSVLQALVTMTRGQLADEGIVHPEVIACFHTINGSDRDPKLKLHDFHSSKKREISPSAWTVGKSDFVEELISNRKVISCGFSKGGLFGKDLSKKSQIVIPVVAWGTSGRFVTGVLSVSALCRFDWSPSHVEWMHRASVCLSSLPSLGMPSGTTDINFRCDRFSSKPVQNLQEFLLKKHRMEFCSIVRSSSEKVPGPSDCTAMFSSRNRPWHQKANWRPWTSDAHPFSRDYNVEFDDRQAIAKIPLYIGPFKVATVRFGPIDDYKDKPELLVGSVCQFWHQVVTANDQNWSIKFRKIVLQQRDELSELNEWKHELTLKE